MEAQYITKGTAGVVREKKQIVLDREFDRIYARDGVITPELVLQEASEKSSPLHDFFDWDNRSAAHKYRLAQARQMLMASRFVVILNKQREAVAAQPMLVRRLIPPVRGEGFKMRNEVMDDDAARNAMVAAKKSELRAWCKSVVDIEELGAIRLSIEKLLK